MKPISMKFLSPLRISQYVVQYRLAREIFKIETLARTASLETFNFNLSFLLPYYCTSTKKNSKIIVKIYT